MVMTKDIILQIANKIKNSVYAKNIILFGSYAHGIPTEDSDVDLCVILENGTYNKREILKKMRKSILSNYLFPLDLVVYTEDEFREKSLLNITLEHEILQTGVRLYAE